MKVVNLKTGNLHEVAKYVKSQTDGEESVWCNEWYGRHVIGKDCAFVKSYQLNTTKPSQKNEMVIPVVNDSFISKPPEPPLCRVMREGIGHFCTNCGSTMPRSGFLMLFGKRYCDNDKCQNSKPPKIYR